MRHSATIGQHSKRRDHFNTLRPRQDGRHFPDYIFKWIFLNENVRISINISPKFVPMGPINNIPTLVQVMACRRPGDKPLSEPMMVILLTHICVTRPQWVKKQTLVFAFLSILQAWRIWWNGIVSHAKMKWSRRPAFWIYPHKPNWSLPKGRMDGQTDGLMTNHMKDVYPKFTYTRIENNLNYRPDTNQSWARCLVN